MHKETKQFFTLYNTLDDKKVYLEKEVSAFIERRRHRGVCVLCPALGARSESARFLAAVTLQSGQRLYGALREAPSQKEMTGSTRGTYGEGSGVGETRV